MKQKKQPFQDVTNTIINGYLGGSESELENNQPIKIKKKPTTSYIGFSSRKNVEEKVCAWQEAVFNGYRKHGKPTKLDQEVIRDYYSMK